MTHNPCYYCPDRKIGCHNPATCQRWAAACTRRKAEKKHLKLENEARKDVNNYQAALHNRLIRAKRCRS